MRRLTGSLTDWLALIHSPRARPFLLVTFSVDSALVFVFLVALQSYLPEQHDVEVSLPAYALAAYGAAKLIAQMLGGQIIDRIGGKQGLVSGLVLILAGQAALLLAVLAPVVVMPAAALYGLGGALVWPAVYALASTAFAVPERARLTAAMTLTMGAALSSGLGLGMVLPEHFPYVAAIALALAIVGIALIGTGAIVPAIGERAMHRQSFAIGILRYAVRSAFDPPRLGFALMMLLQSSAAGALVAIFRAYGRDILSVSFQYELLLLAPAIVTGAGAVALGGILADRFGRTPLLAVGFLTAGGALWFLPSVAGASSVVALTIFASLGLGIALPSVSAMTIDLAGAVNQGTLLGWFMALEGMGHTLGPALGGWVSSIASVGAVLEVVAALYALAAGIAVVLMLTPSIPLLQDSMSRDGIERPVVHMLQDES